MRFLLRFLLRFLRRSRLLRFLLCFLLCFLPRSRGFLAGCRLGRQGARPRARSAALPDGIRRRRRRPALSGLLPLFASRLGRPVGRHPAPGPPPTRHMAAVRRRAPPSPRPSARGGGRRRAVEGSHPIRGGSGQGLGQLPPKKPRRSRRDLAAPVRPVAQPSAQGRGHPVAQGALATGRIGAANCPFSSLFVEQLEAPHLPPLLGEAQRRHPHDGERLAAARVALAARPGGLARGGYCRCAFEAVARAVGPGRRLRLRLRRRLRPGHAIAVGRPAVAIALPPPPGRRVAAAELAARLGRRGAEQA
mmetsp:Transcript_38647/g.86308  ORF Transcript_38647/g.86308 Transcript_38647/m.86308 type:complete len:305 (-) Transcript_38647:1115-2029(-)